MASRTKKAVSNTVTFEKSILVQKLKTLLENEGACEGDWLNKVRVQFLGQKAGNYRITLKVAASCQLEMAADGVPSKEEVAEFIRSEMEEGNLDLDVDDSDFEVEKVEKV